MDGLESSADVVAVYDAPDETTAQVVCATLQAAGIPARIKNERRGDVAGFLPYLALAVGYGVVVAASDADAARAILLEQEPTEEELAAEVDADETSLEEAEARVR